MEQGGACLDANPCWWRTRVVAPDTIMLENFMQSRSSTLTSTELSEVSQIVDGPSFRSAIRSASAVCPVTFDSEYIYTLETASAHYEDKNAGGCILDTEGLPHHVYRDLFMTLDKLRRAHFPGVLPF
jgi:hypothetical protein